MKVNEDMRVEWAQCMARAARWEEEVDPLSRTQVLLTKIAKLCLEVRAMKRNK
jgi:hypothetical protein